VDSHFVEVNKMVSLGSGTQRQINDYELSRYACYLIVIHLAVLEASEDKIMA
jgi:DNA-damage-inducible protein D